MKEGQYIKKGGFSKNNRAEEKGGKEEGGPLKNNIWVLPRVCKVREVTKKRKKPDGKKKKKPG